jgi:hypothetical protein
VAAVAVFRLRQMVRAQTGEDGAAPDAGRAAALLLQVLRQRIAMWSAIAAGSCLIVQWLLGPLFDVDGGPLLDRVMSWALAALLLAVLSAPLVRGGRWPYCLAAFAAVAWLVVGWWRSFAAAV